MGIPLLHPWANRLAGFDYSVDGREVRLPHGPPLVHGDEHGLPIHGVLAASRHWEVVSLEEHGGTARVRAVLDFAASSGADGGVPVPARGGARGGSDGRGADDHHADPRHG